MKKYRQAYLLFGILTVIYIVLSMLTPTDADSLTRYGLNQSQARNLKLTVILPYIAIWFVGIFGALRLRKYADSIKKSKDGKALHRIANGLYLLAIGLIVAAIGSSFRSYIEYVNNDVVWIVNVIVVYLDLAVALWAFYEINKGARSLLGIVKEKYHTLQEYFFIAAYMIVGVSFTYVTLTNPARQFPTEEISRATYYLPDFLILFTVILPYLFVWYLGISAAYCIQRYRKNIEGTIYKSALRYLSAGLVLIIIFRIALRYLASVASSLAADSTLQFILVVLYVLLLTIAAGYLLIIKGTKHLKRLDEV